MAAMERSRRAWLRRLVIVVLLLLLAAWGARRLTVDSRDQAAQRACCMRLRQLGATLQLLAEDGSHVAWPETPVTLRRWAALNPEFGNVSGDDLDRYEVEPSPPGPRDAAALATAVVVRETKPVHGGSPHALFADGHVGVAP